VAPSILGVVNLTEDSFSDGGLFLRPERAIARARELMAAGAHAIDLGAAASHPDAKQVSAAEEIRRLAPVVESLSAEGVPVSVDSCAPETQRWALERGVALLNDIRGFPEPANVPGLAQSSARLIVMHSASGGVRATRDDRDPDAVVAGVLAFFDAKVRALERAGVARERLILDPGMGLFLASTPEPSLRVIRALPRLRQRYGLPILVSVSRKSFLGALTGRAVGERGSATLGAELCAAAFGAEYLRTHDVASLADALRVWDALGSPLFSRDE
jgi:dihydropteroate synthase type 2